MLCGIACEIISLGDELLTGYLPDENAALIASGLWKTGIPVRFITSAGGNEDDIIEILECACRRSKLVLIAGGVGGQAEDIAKKAITRFTKRRLVLSDELLTDMQAKNLLNDNSGQRSIALVPYQCSIIKNATGITPGFIITHMDTKIIFLPGNPLELKGVLEETIPFLKSMFHETGKYVQKRKLILHDITYEDAYNFLRDFLKDYPSVKFEIKNYDYAMEVYLETTADTEFETRFTIENIVSHITQNHIPCIELTDPLIEETCSIMLKKQNRKIAVAESCSGGLVSHRLTNIPGASAYFSAGITAYSNDIKTSILGVPQETLDTHGAVSIETALAMAEGIKKTASTDIGIGITGITGPSGGSELKPVGTVFIAAVSEKKSIAKKFKFTGCRNDIKYKTSQCAMIMLLDILKE